MADSAVVVVVVMVVMIMTTGDHLDAHLTEVAEAILLDVHLMLKGQGGTDQGLTLLMEALREDMGVALEVCMPDEGITFRPPGDDGTVIDYALFRTLGTVVECECWILVPFVVVKPGVVVFPELSRLL